MRKEKDNLFEMYKEFLFVGGPLDGTTIQLSGNYVPSELGEVYIPYFGKDGLEGDYYIRHGDTLVLSCHEPPNIEADRHWFVNKLRERENDEDNLD